VRPLLAVKLFSGARRNINERLVMITTQEVKENMAIRDNNDEALSVTMEGRYRMPPLATKSIIIIGAAACTCNTLE
jgi:hypothetical protein